MVSWWAQWLGLEGKKASSAAAGVFCRAQRSLEIQGRAQTQGKRSGVWSKDGQKGIETKTACSPEGIRSQVVQALPLLGQSVEEEGPRGGRLLQAEMDTPERARPEQTHECLVLGPSS